MRIRVGFGRDIHRFLAPEVRKGCRIGGVTFEGVPGFQSKSDGDVVYHALCHAITSVSGIPILGGRAKELLEKDGITDSSVYVSDGLKTLGEAHIAHVAISLEAMRPRLDERIEEVRGNVAKVLGLQIDQVGITAHDGQGLTDVGCGAGVRCCVVITVEG
ncbi:MAG: 2-C-methyl-D-erythritol 2,4-cyclodiphosphate synthase [Parachlamydiales bacterium]